MTDIPIVPSLRSDVDLTRVSLSVDDMFLVSRIDGRSSVADLAVLIGKKADETQKILERLVELGLVSLGRGSVPPPRRSRPPPKPESTGGVFEIPDNFIFPVGLMQDKNDLDVNTRKRIIWIHENLEKWTYYELLEVDRKADKEAVKKAYRERSKDWHPDGFRAKKLGAFKKLVEAVFKRLTEAQRVLTDVKARLAYDQSVVFEPTEEEMKELLWRAGAEEREKRREEERLQKRIAKNPVLLKKQQAKEFYEAALALEAEGKLMEARRQAQMAVAYDPKPTEYVALVERISDLAVDHRIAPILKRAKYHESMTQWDEAMEYLSEAVRVAPDNGTARLRLAYNMLMARQDIDEVMRHAQKAVVLVPEDAEAHYVAGRCCEAKDMEKNAKKHYEEALRLRPNFQDAKKRLNKLKWGF